MEEHDPTLELVYLPHLDYDHQRFGPDDPRSVAAVGEVDREAGRLIQAARARGATVVAMSEYGIERANRPVFLNRMLHEHGLLQVQETSHGQLLDAGASRAFCVATVANATDASWLSVHKRVAELLEQVHGARYGSASRRAHTT